MNRDASFKDILLLTFVSIDVDHIELASEVLGWIFFHLGQVLHLVFSFDHVPEDFKDLLAVLDELPTHHCGSRLLHTDNIIEHKALFS